MSSLRNLYNIIAVQDEHERKTIRFDNLKKLKLKVTSKKKTTRTQRTTQTTITKLICCNGKINGIRP